MTRVSVCRCLSVRLISALYISRSDVMLLDGGRFVHNVWWMIERITLQFTWCNIIMDVVQNIIEKWAHQVGNAPNLEILIK